MSEALKAVILAVGSEMLTPTKTDTNSLFVTDILNGLGIEVAYKAVVGDDREELGAQVELALARHPILILTGGLGPTDDDITREVVADRLGLQMHEDPALVEAIRARFAARGLSMPEVNRRQAMVPEGATVLENPRGSAPGLLIEHRGAIIALLPGPPREMRPMMSGAVKARLLALAGHRRLLRRLVRVAGTLGVAGRRTGATRLRPWLQQSPPIETTILASPGSIELHLSMQVTDEVRGAAALDVAVEALRARLGPDVVSIDGESLEQAVGELLRARGWRIAFAESCTGGLATSRLTDVAGSSDYVDRSVVVYSNEAKTDLLGVPAALVAAHGAVSEPVVRAMAEGMLARSRAQVAVAITGIAGPGGGSDEKPVGTVWIGVASPNRARRVRSSAASSAAARWSRPSRRSPPSIWCGAASSTPPGTWTGSVDRHAALRRRRRRRRDAERGVSRAPGDRHAAGAPAWRATARRLGAPDGAAHHASIPRRAAGRAGAVVRRGGAGTLQRRALHHPLAWPERVSVGSPSTRHLGRRRRRGRAARADRIGTGSAIRHVVARGASRTGGAVSSRT